MPVCEFVNEITNKHFSVYIENGVANTRLEQLGMVIVQIEKNIIKNEMKIKEHETTIKELREHESYLTELRNKIRQELEDHVNIKECNKCKRQFHQFEIYGNQMCFACVKRQSYYSWDDELKDNSKIEELCCMVFGSIGIVCLLLTMIIWLGHTNSFITESFRAFITIKITSMIIYYVSPYEYQYYKFRLTY
jgi:hypothetical protein